MSAAARIAGTVAAILLAVLCVLVASEIAIIALVESRQ